MEFGASANVGGLKRECAPRRVTFEVYGGFGADRRRDDHDDRGLRCAVLCSSFCVCVVSCPVDLVTGSERRH